MARSFSISWNAIFISSKKSSEPVICHERSKWSTHARLFCLYMLAVSVCRSAAIATKRRFRYYESSSYSLFKRAFQEIISSNCWVSCDLITNVPKWILCNFDLFARKCIAILTFTKIINGIRYPNQENHNNRTQKKKWKLLFSIDFRRCSTFVSCVQKHISNVIYHALCGKDYQQKSKHFFSSQMKFGEFGSIWLASDLFFFCGWTVQSNRPTAHFAFVLSFMLFVCC